MCPNPIPARFPGRLRLSLPGILPAAISCFVSTLQPWAAEESARQAYPCAQLHAIKKK